jgi:intracellular sulfur oxidation DsrE/DsrF family protein
MARDYKVQLIACGNTMTALNWGPDRLIPEAKIEPVGAAALMTFQENGYAYIAW